MLLLVVSMLVASAVIRIDKVVSASGKLVADAPNIVVQPFDQSIVESIDVRKGDIVRKGQVLARLNPTFTAADYTAMKDQVDLLSAKAARLQAEAAGTYYVPDPQTRMLPCRPRSSLSGPASISSSLENFDERIDQLRRQIAGSNAQAVIFATPRRRCRHRGHAREASGASSGSTLNTLLAVDARVTMAGSLAAAQSDADQADRKVAAEQADRQTFVQHWNGRTRKTSPKRAASWWRPNRTMPKPVSTTNSWR